MCDTHLGPQPIILLCRSEKSCDRRVTNFASERRRRTGYLPVGLACFRAGSKRRVLCLVHQSAQAKKPVLYVVRQDRLLREALVMEQP